MLKTKNPKVLVGLLYTPYKEYCKFLWPKQFEDFTYPNKELVLLTDENCPKLRETSIGDVICAWGREELRKIAIEKQADYLFFLDYDALHPADTIERLLETGKPFVGGMVAARGDPKLAIGHKYENGDIYKRVRLQQDEMQGLVELDGIGGCSMLIHNGLFDKFELASYRGVEQIPGRFTCDDEIICMQITKNTGIKPYMLTTLRPWHYAVDGFRYRCWDDVEYWKK